MLTRYENNIKIRGKTMKTIILAGGFGSRISEESHLRPKPMIEIGGMPILIHIMRHFSHYGHNEFIILAGYKQEIIKEYFANYYLHNSDITFDFTVANRTIVHENSNEPWKVTIINTGLNTLTGGRVKRIEKYINNEPFFLTYGDAVSDVNIDNLLAFHQKSGSMVTLTAVQPLGRFGALEIDKCGLITQFSEKKHANSAWINGGFMVCEPELLDYINDDVMLELAPFEKIARDSKMAAYKHGGFWQCMDTLRDKEYLENLILKGAAPWIR